MRLLIFVLALLLDGIIPKGDAYLRQLQQRDSILIADQMEFGFELDSVKAGTQIALPDFSEVSNDTLVVVRSWQIDTLKVFKKQNMVNVRGSVIIAPFEEGTYRLPDIPVQRTVGNQVDTLMFKAPEMVVTTIPVDTTTFEIHDIKGQIRYPVTFREVLPYILGVLLVAALAALVWYLVRRHLARKAEAESKDPAYIIALRQLDKYHGDKFWAPEKQKAFYSGVTDTLKFYIEDRFNVDAPEMTTAELFAELKSDKDITPELYAEMKDLFERADFVKFAKHIASDEENSRVVPLAVKFVTSTYQVQLDEEVKQ